MKLEHIRAVGIEVTGYSYSSSLPMKRKNHWFGYASLDMTEFDITFRIKML